MAKLHECLGHWNVGEFGFVEGGFDGMDIIFYEAIGLVVMKAGSCMFEAIFVSEGVPFFGGEWLPIVSKDFLGWLL